MYTSVVFLFVFFIGCSESSSSSNPGIFNEDYMDPKTVDHKTLSGRWYEHLNTVNNTISDNSFGDVVVLCDETISLVEVIYRWIPSLEECRTTAVRFQPDTAHSPGAAVIRMSTNETLGRCEIRYYDPHPTEGFLLEHQKTHLTDGHHIITRQKDPRNLNDVIEKVLSALNMNIRDFHVKSKDFGCERKEEKGIKL